MRNRLLEFFRKLLAKNLPGRYVISRIITKMLLPKYRLVNGFIGDYRLELDLNDSIQQQIFFGIYDPKETQVIRKLLKPGDLFFDIGANVGYYSFVASQLVGNTGRVHSFEPISTNVTIMKKIIEANAIGNIVLNPVAVGPKSGSLYLYIGNEDLGNSGWASKLASARRTTKVEVQMISLDDYIKAKSINHIRLIKMDIEGSELDALLGGNWLFSQKDAPDIICEVNPFLLSLANLDTLQLTNCLVNFGYLLYKADDLSPVKPDMLLPQLTNLFCTKNKERIGSLRIM